ncbi:MAG: hypothetical protein R6V75_01105 [Bacteroidales bacterium]
MKKYFENSSITFRQVVDILLLVIFLVFILQNLTTVKVRFFVFGLETPLIVILILVFLIGFFTSRAFSRKKKPTGEEPGENK